jgi:hypothetical protein
MSIQEHAEQVIAHRTSIPVTDVAAAFGRFPTEQTGISTCAQRGIPVVDGHADAQDVRDALRAHVRRQSRRVPKWQPESRRDRADRTQAASREKIVRVERFAGATDEWASLERGGELLGFVLGSQEPGRTTRWFYSRDAAAGHAYPTSILGGESFEDTIDQAVAFETGTR